MIFSAVFLSQSALIMTIISFFLLLSYNLIRFFTFYQLFMSLKITVITAFFFIVKQLILILI